MLQIMKYNNLLKSQGAVALKNTSNEILHLHCWFLPDQQTKTILVFSIFGVLISINFKNFKF